MMPIAEADAFTMLFFMFVAATYTLTVAWAILRALAGRLSAEMLTLACIALYAAAMLLIFVGRSHPLNMYHPLVPFAILLTALIARALPAVTAQLNFSVAPLLLWSALLFLLLSKPDFLVYPGLAMHLLHPAARGGLQMSTDPPDLAGIPADSQAFVDEYTLITRTIMQHVDGKTFAILAPHDTVFNYGSHTCSV